MQEYQVPQFIEVEDKVIGPLTLKQFIYVAGGIGLCVIIFLSLPFFLFVILGIPVAALSFGLAFYKINNKNLVDIIEAAITFYTKDRLYLWKKEEKQEEVAAPVAPKVEERQNVVLTQSKLKELAWSLDIKDKPPGGTQ